MFLQNTLNRLENWLATKAAEGMTMNGQAHREASISAIVIRKDGRVEDLGVISTTKVSMLKLNWRNILGKIFK